ncbi:MAG: protein kinase [Lentisphaeraceae bacterium]|nr:protein kinase [Lentisphaeraceae bacterium]
MRFQCSHCDQIVSVEDSERGSLVTCGSCDKQDQVPTEQFGARTVINDYVIIKKIGPGRLASVYLAYQMSLDRNVALKILSQELAEDSDFIIDFFREARSAGRLNHPNIVQAYAVSEEDGIYYLVMEYIQGKNLKQIIEQEGTLPCDYVLRIIHQIAEALAFIWKTHKVCHENIKPENILMTKNKTAKLSDTGLSKAAKRMDSSTPYVCPEKILGSSTDIRSDLYSLGITFYEMLTGVTPFEGSSEEIRKQHLKTLPPDVREFRNDIPESFVRIIDKLLAKHPDDRYQTPDGLISDIKLARVSTSSKKERKAAKKNNRRTQKKANKAQNTKNVFLQMSVFLNVVLLATTILLMSGKTKVSVKPEVETVNNEQVLLYHQIATDMSSGELTQERAESIWEDINSFLNRFPDSPHLPMAVHWKTTLEEIIVRARRKELWEKEQKEALETKKLSNIIEKTSEEDK